MRCFAALFWKIWLPPARWMFAWRLRFAKSPHLTRVNCRIHILYRFAHGCVGQCKWQKRWGGPNAWNHGKGIGIARAWGKAQGSALHRHRARHCTIRGLGTAQVTSYPQNKGFCWDWALRGDRPRRCAGKRPRRCTANAMQCVHFKRPNPLCLPLVISSTFFVTHGRRDSRSLARSFDCTDWPNHDRRWKA